MNKINVVLALTALEPQVTGVERECPGNKNFNPQTPHIVALPMCFWFWEKPKKEAKKVEIKNE